MQVKILVPNSTAGMIIGKGGNFIKQMKEESGSYIQISQKAKDQTLQERCITVIGKSVLWIWLTVTDIFMNLYLIKHTEKLDYKTGNGTEDLIENKAECEKFACVV